MKPSWLTTKLVINNLNKAGLTNVERKHDALITLVASLLIPYVVEWLNPLPQGNNGNDEL